ncbi:hypothetical protein SLA2020_014100 [Shorea laevis]
MSRLSKLSESILGTGPLASRSRSANDESVPSNSYKSSEVPGGSALLWFVAITSTLALIALSMGGSSLFNPLHHELEFLSGFNASLQ